MPEVLRKLLPPRLVEDRWFRALIHVSQDGDDAKYPEFAEFRTPLQAFLVAYAQACKARPENISRHFPFAGCADAVFLYCSNADASLLTAFCTTNPSDLPDQMDTWTAERGEGFDVPPGDFFDYEACGPFIFIAGIAMELLMVLIVGELAPMPFGGMTHEWTRTHVLEHIETVTKVFLESAQSWAPAPVAKSSELPSSQNKKRNPPAPVASSSKLPGSSKRPREVDDASGSNTSPPPAQKRPRPATGVNKPSREAPPPRRSTRNQKP